MEERSIEQPSVDAHGIRPPDAYGIEAREPVAGAMVLALVGEFDLAAAAALREQLDAAKETADRGVVLDLAEVTFVDSAGLRELLRAHEALAAERKRLVLTGLQPAVVRLLELTGATQLLVTAPTLQRGLTLLAEQP
jgi:anti-anti-sigma factor